LKICTISDTNVEKSTLIRFAKFATHSNEFNIAILIYDFLFDYTYKKEVEILLLAITPPAVPEKAKATEL